MPNQIFPARKSASIHTCKMHNQQKQEVRDHKTHSVELHLKRTPNALEQELRE